MNPAAGWYDDPGGSGGQRYWDGMQWTEHVQAAAAPPPPRTQPTVTVPSGATVSTPSTAAGSSASAPVSSFLERYDRSTLFQFGGAALVVVGVLLPWVDVAGLSANAFERDLPWLLTGTSDADEGTLGHGLFFLALAAVSVAVALGRVGSKVVNAAVGLGIVALAVANFLSFADAASDAGLGTFEVIGFGLYVAAIGGGLIAAGALGVGAGMAAGPAPRQAAPAPPRAPSSPPSTAPSPPPAAPSSPPAAGPATPPAGNEGSGDQWWN